MSPIESKLQLVRGRIDGAIAGCADAASRRVALVAVSKAQPAEAVRAAFEAGQRAFGENYAQEGAAKAATLADLAPRGIEWHFLGPVQSNKAGLIARHFDWVQSVDRDKAARALSQRREGAPLNVLIEVNASGEASKGGVAPDAALAFARSVAALPGLRVRGLMSIIEDTPDAGRRHAQFALLKALYDAGRAGGLGFDTLSMGMSGDFPEAIAAGATMVRVGTAIFGARPPRAAAEAA